MRKLYLLSLIFYLFTNLLFSQTLFITYPKEIDSYPGQVLNIPIVVENRSNQVVMVLPDYFSDPTLTGGVPLSYRINPISPKAINPGTKELVFISLMPSTQLRAGKHSFPFTIKDTAGRVLTDGVFDISHIVIEDLDIISLTDHRYIVPDRDFTLSYLVVNKGSIPVEFKTADFLLSHIVQPGDTDTLRLNLSNIGGVVRTDYWVSISLDYIITKIHPDKLEQERHSINRTIPIAHRTGYPSTPDYMQLPVNFSQTFVYDETHYAYHNISRRYRARLWSAGYVDDFPAPYLAWNIDYRYDDYGFKLDRDVTGSILYRSETLSFKAGETSFMMDLKRTEKWGLGYDISYNLNGIYFQKGFVKEEYRDEAVHNSMSFGAVWDYDSGMYEPQQFMLLRHYQKNTKEIKRDWLRPYNHSTTEYQKIVLDWQFKVLDRMRFHFELYTARDDTTKSFAKPAFTGEMHATFPYVNNRFFIQLDELNIAHNLKYRRIYQNDLNIYTPVLQLSNSIYYHDEYTPSTAWMPSEYRYDAYSLGSNVNLMMVEDLYLRGKHYNATTKIALPNKLRYSDHEYIGGMMYKSDIVMVEALTGQKYEKYSNWTDNTFHIGELNLAFYTRDNKNYQVNLNNRLLVQKPKPQEKTLFTQISIYSRYTNTISHSYGIYNANYSENDWKNTFISFMDFYYTLPWKHHIRVSGVYNFNPSYTENYRYSISAEYSMPFNISGIPKSNSRYTTISVYDPWQRKPVSDAVFEIDNRYFITNEDGIVRPRKKQVQDTTRPIRMINLPAGFDISPPLSSLTKVKSSHATLQIVNLSNLSIKVKIRSYQRVAPTDAAFVTNLAYFQNTLVDRNRHTIIDCDETIEIVLTNIHNPTDTRRALSNATGYVTFELIPAGEYSISINDAVNDNFLIDDTTSNTITIPPNRNINSEITLRENITEFIKYER